MADRELNLKVSASTRDATGQVRLFGRELRQLDREVDRTSGGMRTLGQSLDRIERGQRQGVLSPGQAAALRFRARAQQFQERFGGALTALPGGGAIAGAAGAAAMGGPLAIAMVGLSSAIGMLVQQLQRNQTLIERGFAVGRDPNEIRRLAAIATRLGIRPENVPVEAIARRARATGRTLQDEFVNIIDSMRGLPPAQRAAALTAQLGRGGAVLGGAAIEARLTAEQLREIRPFGGDLPAGVLGGARAVTRARGITGEALERTGATPLDVLFPAPSPRLLEETKRLIQEAFEAALGTRDTERRGEEPGGGVGVDF